MQEKPIFVTFWELANALQLLHQGNPVWMKRLHDVWLLGAPSPRSIVRNAVGYDPRFAQAGNFEERLLLPTQYVAWVMDCAKERGIQINREQALAMMQGKTSV